MTQTCQHQAIRNHLARLALHTLAGIVERINDRILEDDDAV